MITYAQNFEDVLLERAFRDQAAGFYIDLGAGHPVNDSVTQHFYERGWSGINVEPDPKYFAELAEARTRDVNLNVAVGSRTGRLTFYEIAGSGLSTLHDGYRADATKRGFTALEGSVEVVTLSEICRRHVDGTIDFLKIDVEGWERAVIEGADWQAYRPRIILVEATLPNTQIPAWHEWEPLLLGARYRFAYFDGLNRFYVNEDEPELLKHFSVPANFFDGFLQWRTVVAERERDAVRETQAQLSAEKQALSYQLGVLAEEQNRLSVEREILLQEKGQLLRENGRLLLKVQAMRASLSWRITAPFRRVRKVLRRLTRP